MEWILRPVKPKIVLYYGASCLYFWMLAKEPLNPDDKLDPDFVPDCYFDQLLRKFSTAGKNGTRDD